MNKNVSSPAPEGAIPGWRVIVSDTGRFWASRETPFPWETEWYAPPYRTVDADTLDELRAEVERQEEAARDLEAACGQTAGWPGGAERETGREAAPGGEEAPSGAVSGRGEV